ncbi:MAG: hypothetical protein EBR82_48230 [Caulobacteraceae bacterium]|nr:hypothetical protein [Caulobacteraceae bacterium]
MFSDIFSTITSGIKELSDWIYPEVKQDAKASNREVNPILKAGITGLGAAYSSAKENEDFAIKNTNVGGNMQGVNQQFDPTKTGYGLEQYANDAAAIENRWKQVLTQFVSPTQVK